MQISSVEFSLFLIAGAIVSAGWMIATAIRQLRSTFLHESQRMIDRFCDFAFEPVLMTKPALLQRRVNFGGSCGRSSFTEREIGFE
jgi:hypothetical protein